MNKKEAAVRFRTSKVAKLIYKQVQKLQLNRSREDELGIAAHIFFVQSNRGSWEYYKDIKGVRTPPFKYIPRNKRKLDINRINTIGLHTIRTIIKMVRGEHL